MNSKKPKNNKIPINAIFDNMGFKDLIVENPEDLEKLRNKLKSMLHDKKNKNADKA